MRKFFVFLPLLFFGAIFFLRKYVKKNISADAYSVYGKISLILVIVVSISCFIFMFKSLRPIDSTYGWNVDFMNYNNLHKYSTGKSQKIALIDTGISAFQLEKTKKNSIVLVGDTYDQNGHGTMMYSLIKGYNNQILGIAPDAEVISIKIINIDEKLSPNLLYDAIKLAIDQKCTIINLSLGSYIENQEISDIIDVAIKNGITVVSSSGDYEDNDLMFPAIKPNVISVGSLSAENHISKFTNAPSECVIIAPGDDIKTIDYEKKITNTSGTSQATSIISGYIALLKDYSLSENIKLSNEEIKNIMISINKNKYDYVTALKKLK